MVPTSSNLTYFVPLYITQVQIPQNVWSMEHIPDAQITQIAQLAWLSCLTVKCLYYSVQNEPLGLFYIVVTAHLLSNFKVSPRYIEYSKTCCITHPLKVILWYQYALLLVSYSYKLSLRLIRYRLPRCIEHGLNPKESHRPLLF